MMATINLPTRTIYKQITSVINYFDSKVLSEIELSTTHANVQLYDSSGKTTVSIALNQADNNSTLVSFEPSGVTHLVNNKAIRELFQCELVIECLLISAYHDPAKLDQFNPTLKRLEYLRVYLFEKPLFGKTKGHQKDISAKIQSLEWHRTGKEGESWDIKTGRGSGTKSELCINWGICVDQFLIWRQQKNRWSTLK